MRREPIHTNLRDLAMAAFDHLTNEDMAEALESIAALEEESPFLGALLESAANRLRPPVDGLRPAGLVTG